MVDEARDSRTDVMGAASGEETALLRLLERHLPRLRGFVRLQAGPLVRAKESCSDLVQSVCREVLEDMGGFEFRGEAAFRHWLFQRALRKILRRQAFYTAGRRDAGKEVPQGDTPDPALLDAYGDLCTPSQQLMGREGVERIEAAVDGLPEAQREAILLHRVVGLSYAEIAAETGRKEGAIRTNVYRGLAELGLRLSQ